MGRRQRPPKGPPATWRGRGWHCPPRVVLPPRSAALPGLPCQLRGLSLPLWTWTWGDIAQHPGGRPTTARCRRPRGARPSQARAGADAERDPAREPAPWHSVRESISAGRGTRTPEMLQRTPNPLIQGVLKVPSTWLVGASTGSGPRSPNQRVGCHAPSSGKGLRVGGGVFSCQKGKLRHSAARLLLRARPCQLAPQKIAPPPPRAG